MYDDLWSRFSDAVGSSIEDPDLHLSYTDRRRLERGEHADVAREKLSALERKLRWTKWLPVVAAVLLTGGAVLTGLSGLDIGPWALEDASFSLYFAFIAGLLALGVMWRRLKLEKQKLLCELVLAHDGKRPSGETAASEEEAAIP